MNQTRIHCVALGQMEASRDPDSKFCHTINVDRKINGSNVAIDFSIDIFLNISLFTYMHGAIVVNQ